MKQVAPIIFSLLFFSISFPGISQQSTGFSKPELKLEDNILVISFDILNSMPTEKFAVDIEVSDSEGKKIRPRSVFGDIGENVSGGNRKIIKWDLVADQIPMDQVLYVEVVGSRMADGGPGQKVEEDGIQITRIGAIGRSVAFPGWGLSKVNPGKPHWIKGVAGYGSIAGALILNQRAHANYQNYLDSSDPVERDNYFNKSENQEQFSNIMAYTAAGIWVAEMVWTVIGTRGLSKKNVSAQRKGFSVGPDYESAGNMALLSMKYRF